MKTLEEIKAMDRWQGSALEDELYALIFRKERKV